MRKILRRVRFSRGGRRSLRGFPTELKVTFGGTVIKQEPMTEYGEVPRQQN
jgi:hypothetical protein